MSSSEEKGFRFKPLAVERQTREAAAAVFAARRPLVFQGERLVLSDEETNRALDIINCFLAPPRRGGGDKEPDQPIPEHRPLSWRSILGLVTIILSLIFLSQGMPFPHISVID
jgi:hypothetical protein